MRMYRNLLLVLSICVAACHQVPKTVQPAGPIAPVLPDVDLSSVLTPTELTALTESQRQAFHRFLNLESYREQPMQVRVGYFLSDWTMGFQYDGATYKASQTMAADAGNCISLALLAKALADEAKIPISFRVTYRDPVMDINNGVLVNAAHVRSYLLGSATEDEQGNRVYQSSVAIDYFKDSLDYLGPPISNETFLAMVYNNFAAEAFLKQDLVTAKAYTVAALRVDLGFAPAANLLAVLLRREGQIAQSSQWYDYAIARNPHNIMLLSNYQLLAQETGNTALYQRLEQVMNQLPESDDPYAWYILAMQAEEQGHPRQAMHFYEKLLAKAPYLLPANQAMLRLLLEKQQFRQAQTLLKTALEASYTPEKRAIYEQKLAGLRLLQQKQVSN